MIDRRLFLLGTALALTACGPGADEQGQAQRQQIGQVWKYEKGGKKAVAYIGSTNAVKTLSAPDTFAVMLLNKLSNGATQVTVKLVGAPFTCEISDCAVEGAADAKPLAKWHGRRTDAKDGVAIPPSQPAMKAIEAGKTVTVALEVEPKRVERFTFATAGLDWE